MKHLKILTLALSIIATFSASAVVEHCPATITCPSIGHCDLPTGYMVYQVLDWKSTEKKFTYAEAYANIGDKTQPMVFCYYWDSKGDHIYTISNERPFYYARVIENGAGPWHEYQGYAYCETFSQPDACSYDLYKVGPYLK